MKEVYSPLLKEAYYEMSLPSGFQIFLYPKPGIYNKGAFLAVGYGSLYERFVGADGNTYVTPPGTAHFLEHKLFENESGDLFESMARFGADVNAYTALDHTCYYFTAPDHFYESLGHLLQLPILRAYTEAGVASERSIIASEIDMYLDSLDYRSYRTALSALYPKHPIGQDIAGTKESIESITKETLEVVMDQFYVPANMFLFVIGDFSPTEMDRLLESLPPFYHEARPRAKVLIERDESVPDETLLVEHDETPLAVFDYLLKLEPIGDPVLAFRRYIKYNLILDVLFGKGSAFFEDTYRRGILTDLAVEYHYGPGYRYISFSGEGRDPTGFRTKLDDLLAGFHQTGVSMEEVERIKRKTMGQFLMGFNSINHIAHTFIAFYYRQARLFDFLDIVESMALDDFMNLFDGSYVFSTIEEESAWTR